MLTINTSKEKTSVIHKYLLGSVAPRPIAFASTVDKDGKPNLSPFSFFNAFSANPPILVFSPARRVRDNTTKHTFENAKETGEVVISVVTFDMAQQVSLSSADFPKGISEFDKAGFTPVPSEMIAPFRVKESPVNFECRVNDIIELGSEGGAGNLIICEVLLMHINEDILDGNKAIDPLKIDLVSRLGGAWYGRTRDNAIFEMEKPSDKTVIGLDQLPAGIKNSEILTGRDLALLADVESIPLFEKQKTFSELPEVKKIAEEITDNSEMMKKLHLLAKEKLSNGNVEEAWKVLLSIET